MSKSNHSAEAVMFKAMKKDSKTIHMETGATTLE